MNWRNVNATRTLVSTLGILLGLAGIEHGIGEIVQGNMAPDGIMILSWPGSAFFRIVAGEPAMTIVPNFLVTGCLAVLVSAIFLAWATRFVQRKNGGLVLMLLSIAMLLVGGGIFPPVIGIILGILGTRINVPLTWWQAHFSIGLRHFLGTIWPWSFAVCLAAWLFLFPGINVVSYFFGVNDSNLTVTVLGLALGSLLLTILAGFARDSQTDPLPTVSLTR